MLRLGARLVRRCLIRLYLMVYHLHRQLRRYVVEFYDAVYHIAWLKETTLEKLSLGMGHTAGYVTRQKSRGSLPRIDTAIKILDACGYELCAVPKGEAPENAIMIDPPAEEE